LGSAAETEYLLLLSLELGYLDRDVHQKLETKVKQVQRMLVAFANALDRQTRRPMADGRQPQPGGAR